MSKWPHFNKLKFLDDFITAKWSVSNYKVYTYNICARTYTHNMCLYKTVINLQQTIKD